MTDEELRNASWSEMRFEIHRLRALVQSLTPDSEKTKDTPEGYSLSVNDAGTELCVVTFMLPNDVAYTALPSCLAAFLLEAHAREDGLVKDFSAEVRSLRAALAAKETTPPRAAENGT